MMSEEKLIESFEAVDDEGNPYTVHIFQTILHASRLSGKTSSRGGKQRAVTSDGESLNVLDSEVTKLQIVQTGQILNRVDP